MWSPLCSSTWPSLLLDLLSSEERKDGCQGRQPSVLQKKASRPWEGNCVCRPLPPPLLPDPQGHTDRKVREGERMCRRMVLSTHQHKRTTLSYIFFRYRIWEKRFLQNGTPLFLRGGGAPARNGVTEETCPIEMLAPYCDTNFDNKKYQRLKAALINQYPHRPGRWRQKGQVFTAAETGKMQLQAKGHWGLQEKSLWETLRRHGPVTPWLKTSSLQNCARTHVFELPGLWYLTTVTATLGVSTGSLPKTGLSHTQEKCPGATEGKTHTHFFVGLSYSVFSLLPRHDLSLLLRT